MSWYDAIKIANNIWETEELKRHYLISNVQQGGDGLTPHTQIKENNNEKCK
jgi:hypothetical protein